MKKANWQNWTNIVLGVWCFITPWIVTNKMSHEGAKMMSWNAWIVGAAIVVVAWAALLELKPWEEWMNLVLGIWLIVTPWIFGFVQDRTSLWNSVLTGFAVAVISGLALPTAQKASH